ncbi:MAG: Fic family protein, partial [Erysipelotrichaceae bacterium]|nr:Fic family protein [Erysipelotrichaceae bacterium]
MKGTVEKKDLPDGEFFRKGYVYINNGLKTVHQGFYPEHAVNRGMSEFLNLYNDSSKEIFERMILTHYMIEAVHPFYDGNGRLGRFLFTLGLYAETGSCLSFSVASAFNHKRSAYYKAFNEAQHEHMFGSLNSYFEDISSILHSYFASLNQELQEKKSQIDSFSVSSSEFTKSEQKILKMLTEAALLSEFGITNNEIIEHGD